MCDYDVSNLIGFHATCSFTCRAIYEKKNMTSYGHIVALWRNIGYHTEILGRHAETVQLPRCLKKYYNRKQCEERPAKHTLPKLLNSNSSSKTPSEQ